jgi:hypothetical protein
MTTLANDLELRILNFEVGDRKKSDVLGEKYSEEIKNPEENYIPMQEQQNLDLVKNISMAFGKVDIETIILLIAAITSPIPQASQTVAAPYGQSGLRWVRPSWS